MASYSFSFVGTTGTCNYSRVRSISKSNKKPFLDCVYDPCLLEVLVDFIGYLVGCEVRDKG